MSARLAECAGFWQKIGNQMGDDANNQPSLSRSDGSSQRAPAPRRLTFLAG